MPRMMLMMLLSTKMIVPLHEDRRGVQPTLSFVSHGSIPESAQLDPDLRELLRLHHNHHRRGSAQPREL